MKRPLSTITARSFMIFALATSALTSGGAQAHAAEDPNWLHSTYGPYSTQQACINALSAWQYEASQGDLPWHTHSCALSGSWYFRGAYYIL